MSSLEEREVGAHIRMMAIRYMWSAMDSESGTPKRGQPVRGVVLRRSIRWKKGTGVLGAGERRGRREEGICESASIEEIVSEMQSNGRCEGEVGRRGHIEEERKKYLIERTMALKCR